VNHPNERDDKKMVQKTFSLIVECILRDTMSTIYDIIIITPPPTC
jgi:hypothetical protein